MERLQSVAGGLVSAGLLQSPEQVRRELGLFLDEREARNIVRLVREGDGQRPASLYWVQECTQTFDEHWKAKGLDGPFQAFPSKPYMPWLFRLLESERRLLVPKSRDMVVSWSAMAYAVWRCQTQERTRVMIQTQKEDKGIELVCGAKIPGYAKTLYMRQWEGLKEKFPLADKLEAMPGNLLAWKNESVIQAVPKGADQIRLYHPTVLIFDEAAHLDEFEAAYGAADPVCQQIIAVSSVTPGWFWDEVHPDGKIESP